MTSMRALKRARQPNTMYFTSKPINQIAPTPTLFYFLFIIYFLLMYFTSRPIHQSAHTLGELNAN